MKGILRFLKNALVQRLLYGVLLISIILFTALGDSGIWALHGLYNTKGQLEKQIQESKNKADQLKIEQKKLVNPDYLELTIRKELGFVKDGETVYELKEN